MSTSETVLIWSADVDIGNIVAVRDQIDTALAEAGPTKLVIDLAELTFIDSTGLGTLVYAFHECRKREVQFAIRHVPERTMRLLVISKLDQVLSIECYQR